MKKFERVQRRKALKIQKEKQEWHETKEEVRQMFKMIKKHYGK